MLNVTSFQSLYRVAYKCYYQRMITAPLSPGQSGLQNLEDRLPEVEPYLFNLADQVLDDVQHADWNLLVGDDTSGRLPTYFIRRVLAENGYDVPTRFVAGSKVLHEELGSDSYRDYFGWMVHSLGQSSTRALIVTESTSSGKTMNLLTSCLAPYVEAIDTAAVANYYVDKYKTTYAGGSGKDAGFRVFHAFESQSLLTTRSRHLMQARKYIPQPIKNIIPARLKAVGIHPSNDLLGLRVPQGATYPIAHRRPDNPHSARAYHAVDALVHRYNSRSPRVDQVDELTTATF
jgi:hypothetical protein